MKEVAGLVDCVGEGDPWAGCMTPPRIESGNYAKLQLVCVPHDLITRKLAW